ncbi:MAG TPA: ABC transporter substrate-binding protein [Clostridiales bacterium]|nr:ABC transporter substrate-binding protein [Clostridiales bacterium]
MCTLKKIVLIALSTCMLLSFTACSSKDDGVLTMATNAAFPPYEYYENEAIVGIDVEIAQAIADKLDMELKVEDMEFGSIITAVQTGKVDIGLAGMTVREDRLLSVNFSTPYTKAYQAIIVTENSKITGPDDLANKSVGVQESTTGDIYVTDDYPDADVQRYSKGVEAVQALLQGKVDAVVIDNEPAKVFVKQNEGLKILPEAYTEEEYAIAISKKNDDLLKKINDALAELTEDGTLKSIIDKYITAD